jgi:4-hydroxythreonine-4-phosphate dehydrogenase
MGIVDYRDPAGTELYSGIEFCTPSPDHCTAYDIAGKNLASEISFREALFAATHIVKYRRETAELGENPLLITKLSRDRD